MNNETTSSSYGALFALGIFIVASVWLGTQAQRAIKKGSFVTGFFIGNRGLGAWTLALTATVQSGGTFMGFPSLAYSYGWIVALWIGSYMVVPITGFGILAKRMSQLSRRTGAITVPDLLRERFQSPAIGLTASLLIMFFLSFMLVGQFKAGALIIKVAWPSAEKKVDPETKPAANSTANSTSDSAKLAASSPSTSEKDNLQKETSKKEPNSKPQNIDWMFYLGLAIFSVTVVGYTMIGGFLAAVWTDLFQSVMMIIGVAILFALVTWKIGSPEYATNFAMEHLPKPTATSPATANPNNFVYGPGYNPTGREFLPLTFAASYFFVWIFGGLGAPATQVRLMACKDTATIRRSVFLLSVYNFFIYFPILFIAIAGRVIMPDLGKSSDEVVPRMAIWATQEIPLGSLISGLILAAPFGAVMATVSSYMVVIASGVVRDIYQGFLKPKATAQEIRLITNICMVTIGVIAIAANIQPINYLQALVVFCTSGGAASFFMPAMMAAFWRRATAAGVLASMLSGSATTLALLLIGIFGGPSFDQKLGPETAFRSYYFLEMEPVVWGLVVSAICGVVVSLLTAPPPESHVSMLFDKHEPEKAVA